MESYYISSAYLYRRVRWPELALLRTLPRLLPFASGVATASTAIVQLCEACSKWEKLVCKPLASSVKFNILLATHTWYRRSGQRGAGSGQRQQLRRSARFRPLFAFGNHNEDGAGASRGSDASPSSVPSNRVELIRRFELAIRTYRKDLSTICLETRLSVAS